MDKEPQRVASRSQYLVIRVQHDSVEGFDPTLAGSHLQPRDSPWSWDWNALDYSPVTDESPTVLVYGIFDGDFGAVPDRENPSIYWHRPHGHDF